ncbi:MAG: hypothetical protein NZ840_11660 [Anaerolineales bacterium]|nr:hypothetical protein [Anaerolineales bacterium]MDW8162691.1 hypothetical protein [Anaerolineales bacterium]
MNRVIASNNASPERVIVVDGGGNGDFTSIQMAINAAAARSPSAASPWLVLIAPGSYAESLTLVNHVHLAGLGGGATVALQGSTSPLIEAAACTVRGLRLEATVSPLIRAASNFSGKLTLQEVGIESTLAEQDALRVDAGQVELTDCRWTVGGRVVVNGGTLIVRRSHLIHQHSSALAPTQAVIEVSGGALFLEFSLVENKAHPASGGSAVKFSVQAPTAVKVFYCVLRAASGYSVDATVNLTAVIAACRMNAEINTSKIGGVLDYAYYAAL